MMFEVGQQFAQFKIVRMLGEGGMGAVYLAEDQKLNRTVAIKILQPEYSDNVDRLARLEREAKTAAGINHPNVMAIYDMDKVTEESTGKVFTYIVMEHIKGISLTEYLAETRSSLKEKLRIVEKIASGLAAAHKLNIVHRDIKTDNIMLDANDDPKILDFGLAKPVEVSFSGNDASDNTATSELTQEGKIMGTVSYMSPEQARGEAVDGRSDIFSFGIMLYRIVTGSFPFDAKDRVSTLAKILEGRHTSIRQQIESLPAELERIVDKCLQKDPRDRYQSTRDLVVDLRSLRRQFESGITDTMSSISDIGPAAQPKSSMIGKIKTAGIAIAALAVALFLFQYLTDKNEQSSGTSLQAHENALAILGFENKTGDTEYDWLQAGLPEILLTDLAQYGNVNLISRNRVNDLLKGGDDKQRTHQEYIDAARDLGATKVLSGAFYKMGDRIRIDARMEDLSNGQIIMGEKVIGTDPFTLVDSLTQKIALSLDVRDVFEGNRDVTNFTSSSPEAYKEYILGMEKFDFFMQDEAVEHFKKAIAIDSTFALPYMRIGMGYALQGRGQQGMSYLKTAMRFEDKLPVKERMLLDIYADIWVHTQWDDGIVKIESFVKSYPDEKEARSFYAILLSALKKDKIAALAQLDTVLMIDPRYAPAFTWLVQIYSGQDDNENAIKYAKLKAKYYPHLAEPFETLARLYRTTGQYENAIASAHELLERFPSSSSALSTLSGSFVQLRNFDSAQYYNEMRRDLHSDDLYKLAGYYTIQHNIEFWRGNFSLAWKVLHKGLDVTLRTKDSAQISGFYELIAAYFQLFEMKDSTRYYAHKAWINANQFSKAGYPLTLISLDPANEAEARPMLEDALMGLRGRLPEEMWPLIGLLEQSFDAFVASDTARLIEISERMKKDHQQISTMSELRASRLMINFGMAEEGIKILEKMTQGPERTRRCVYWIIGTYSLGVSYQKLGRDEEAIEQFKTVLKYWDKADVQLDLIKDSRQRLKELAAS